ncbi:aminodeoxychorismate synthase component I [Salimicrobium flavidum]|uniref:Aminodeoxychorismate synthase, subunit I /aminodeoxychorismate lyase apoprotein n=1 Tax=Salimicrobium flavidum TaxID=570947 RepID=A0A1N7ITH5_9BACI|nr:aminodeoxychorismate synthase component I [Salimicrobium flavidum]SIS40395.1 aminodeoxychorismate synthase, subunit I /aminodeoxychorismate lyase apoprotein [Salimicrobium flavidum]
MHLHFRFEGKSLVFRDPEAIIEADTIKEVNNAFTEIERWLDSGYYLAGYVAYEAAPAFDPAFQVRDPRGPLLWFGVFRHPEHDADKNTGRYEISEWELDAGYQTYRDGIGKIKEAIGRGDTYQVNYTARWKADFKGDPYAFFEKLARGQQGQYSAYLETGTSAILSASPELFFKKEKSLLTTRPMKGTAARGRTFEEDERNKAELFSSEKERAENVMIVDLLRNDIGRVAEKVRVPHLFSIETYPTVHQLTSTVEGDIDVNTSLWELFRALFPCGSITGAPKVKTMEYIKSLEETPRDVYCGAIGYITPERDMVFNVPIRTVKIEDGEAVYGSGGGITWDSGSYSEYEEMKIKAKLLDTEWPVFHLLETMKAENGSIPQLDRHMKRLEQSAAYFSYPFDETKIHCELKRVTGGSEIEKVRLLLSEEGEVHAEAEAYEDIEKTYRAFLAATPIDKKDLFYYHKTTNRAIYDRRAKEGADTVLLWNENRELTEFTFANLVVKKAGNYFTPPVESGLLAGVKRQELVEKGSVQEQTLYVDELPQFEEIWMVNGLRGWIRVEILEENDEN